MLHVSFSHYRPHTTVFKQDAKNSTYADSVEAGAC